MFPKRLGTATLLLRKSPSSQNLLKYKFPRYAAAFSTAAPVHQSKCPVTHDASEPHPKSTASVRKLTFTEDEFKAAKPFSQIPGPSALQFLSRIVFPWGRYHGLDMVQIFTELRREYGDLVRFPAVLGRQPMFLVCDPREFEVIFRNEGATPFRKNLELFDYFRRKERADMFGEFGGLVQDQGWAWQSTRTKVNPIMMQPKTVKRYIGAVDEISREFIQRIRTIRDERLELPADFANEMNKWALESISYIALNQRLGLLRGTDRDSKGQQLIEAVKVFLELSFKMEFMPSLWRYYPTKDYKRMMAALHTLTK